VLPVLIRGTHEVLGKGSLIPRRHPVEVRIGARITATAMRALVDSTEGAGAYRKLADLMRESVMGLASSNRRALPLEAGAGISPLVSDPAQPKRRSSHPAHRSTHGRAKA
jgi:hypothetical protein